MYLLFFTSDLRLERVIIYACEKQKEKEIDEKTTRSRGLTVRRLVLTALVLLLPAASVHAAMLDLTTVGAWGTINGANFQQFSDGAAGSGNIDSFVRIQKTGVEQGYNTSGRPVEFDENTSLSFTHSLLLSEVPIVTNGGTSFREFLLDINQSGVNLLSLDDLEIALHASGDLIEYSTIFALPIYDMNAPGEDNWVKLDYSLNAGSGAGDMLAYIPDSFFMDEFGVYLNDYVYLYSKFGENLGANDGFEEWAHGVGAPIPEPGTILLLGLGSLALLRKRRN